MTGGKLRSLTLGLPFFYGSWDGLSQKRKKFTQFRHFAENYIKYTQEVFLFIDRPATLGYRWHSLHQAFSSGDEKHSLSHRTSSGGVQKMCSSGSRSPSRVVVRTTVCCCGLLMLAGCGNSDPSLGKLVPVQGKVTLSGKPLSDGEVMFVLIEKDDKAPPPPRGQIETDGSYTLSTKGKPGAPLGKYRAVLFRGEDRKAWFPVALKYFSQQKSPLEVEVVEDKPEGGYDLKLLPRSKVRP